MTETVKFNVGGTIYEVSRSLLERYPGTMLAKSASKRWQEDSMSEIFIERDGVPTKPKLLFDHKRYTNSVTTNDTQIQ